MSGTWPPPGRVPTPIRNFLSMVAMDTKVSMKKMLSASDDASIVAARDAAMWLAHWASHDLAAIGEMFGGRDVPTVEASLARVERLIEVDPNFAAFLGSYEFVITMPVDGGG